MANVLSCAFSLIDINIQNVSYHCWNKQNMFAGKNQIPWEETKAAERTWGWYE